MGHVLVFFEVKSTMFFFQQHTRILLQNSVYRLYTKQLGQLYVEE